MRGHIQRRGKDSWRLKYELSRDTRTNERRIAYKTIKGKRADAEKELRALLTDIDRGIQVEPSQITIAEYLDNWLANVAPQTVGRKALERYEGLARNQIKPYLGLIQLQKLRPASVWEWMQGLVSEGTLSTRSIRAAHGVLRTALGHAAAIEIVPRNVAAVVKPPKLTKPDIQILTQNQIANAIRELSNLSIYPIFCIALGTGARRGEIAALRWSDFDLGAATMKIERALEQTGVGIHVKQPKTKAGRRKISLPAFVVSALRDHRVKALETRLALGAGLLPPEMPVFGDIDGNWPTPFSISDRWRNALKNRNIPKITFHALRHTHASALINAGLDVVAISRRLGHASPTITLSIYGHLFENDDSAAASAIDKVLENSVRVPIGCQLGHSIGPNPQITGKKLATPTGFEPVLPA